MLGLDPPERPVSAEAKAPLRFDDAERGDLPAEVTCSVCSRVVSDRYFQINGRVLCEPCATAARAARESGSGAGRFLRALALGTLGGAVGAAIWYGIRVTTNRELGIIAIAVGLLVGVGVRKGSNGRGGWRYQALAMAITYASICSTYVPDLVSAVRTRLKNESVSAPQTVALSTSTAAPAPASVSAPPPSGDAANEVGTVSPGQYAFAWVLLFGVALAMPFLMGFENAIGIVIIAIGVYEAWKINRRTPFEVTGPHAVGRKGAVSAVSALSGGPPVAAGAAAEPSPSPFKPS